MAAARALVCALVLLLACAASASAKTAPGAWPKLKSIKHLHFETKPIVVKPGQNSIDNVFVPGDQKPSVDGYIVRARPDLRYVNGKVPPVDVIHLHHGVWLNVSGTSPAAPIGNIEPIFFGGEEKTVFRIPRGYGYAYKKSDTWMLNQMIHNNTPNRTKVKLVWDLDFIPASSKLARKVTPVTPMWMDVRRGWAYPVFDVVRGRGGSDGRGSFTFPDQATPDPYANGTVQNEYTMPFDGTAVAAVGHLHPGGLRDDVYSIRGGVTKRIFRSQAKYYDPAGPVSWDVSLTASRSDWRVLLRKGDTLRISATYEDAKSSWYENMGIVLLFVARGDSSGRDPFTDTVNWRGVLTHGHLAENDNHGGGRAVLPDPRKASDGPVTQEVRISDFQFLPGDLGLLFGNDRIPVVPQGQSLAFVNQDDPNVEWHSITTCAAPCNRATGISYPLANGTFSTQFDSGQLGFGPPGASPATGSLTWKTPSNLGPGTYTYFCRVHSFMRGAFRVK
jgi:plastocyanin